MDDKDLDCCVRVSLLRIDEHVKLEAAAETCWPSQQKTRIEALEFQSAGLGIHPWESDCFGRGGEDKKLPLTVVGGCR